MKTGGARLPGRARCGCGGRGVPGRGPGLGDQQGRGNHRRSWKECLPGLPRMGPLKGAAGRLRPPALICSAGPPWGPRRDSGPSSSSASLCAWGQDGPRLGTRPLAAGFTCPSLPFGPVKWEAGPGRAYLSRWSQEESSSSTLLRATVTPVSAACLPSYRQRWQSTYETPPPRGWARRARHRPRRPACLRAAPPPWLRPPTPTQTTALLPADPPGHKLSPKQIDPNERLQGPPRHLLGRSPTAAGTGVPARPAACDPRGWGWGEGANSLGNFTLKG